MAANATSFQPGNVAAMTHGGRSQQARENYRKTLLAEMRELVDRALGESHPADDILRDMLAAALADVRQLDDWITKAGGPISAQGRVYGALTLRRSRERDALQLGDRLGLGPKARTQILAGAVATDGLATQLARARMSQPLRLATPGGVST